MTIRKLLKETPLLGTFARSLYWRLVKGQKPPSFPGVHEYWESRYRSGGNSGSGSYNELAEFKAQIINDFVADRAVKSVIEFGCGDGNQLLLADYPQYYGFDISTTAIERCKTLFKGDPDKQFAVLENRTDESAQLTLSLDVIYHLVDDRIFDQHMSMLFDAATRFVCIYSSNHDQTGDRDVLHVRHRCFTDWIDANRPDWQLSSHVPNKYPQSDESSSGSFADFYFFEKIEKL